MVQESTAIAYPYPDLSSGQDAGESDQHDGALPNFLTYFRTDLDAAVRPYAFAQVTGLRLRAVGAVRHTASVANRSTTERPRRPPRR